MSYEFSFEFIPDYWQEEWNDESTEPFIVEYNIEAPEPSVGLMFEDFEYRVTYEGKDITDDLNGLNQRQVEQEIKEDYVKVCGDYSDNF
jgi:hypothetical protein